MKDKYKSLYEVTGRIEDVATFLVPIRDLPPQRKPLTDECERDCCGNTFKKVSEVCSRICPNGIKPK